MKIAIISDIHGNMEAFESVLNDIQKENADKIVCLGDIAMAGPEPVKTVEKVMELSNNDNFVLVQGNTDKMLSEYSSETVEKIARLNEIMANAYKYDHAELLNEHIRFLANIQPKAEFDYKGISVLFVHGSPRANDENIFPDMELSVVEEMLRGVPQQLIFCGHTHLPCGYQTNSNQTVVNVGSVGRPFSEDPKSCYAILEIDDKTSAVTILHKFVSYDFKTASNKLAKRSYFGSDILAKMLEKASSRYPE